MSKKDNSFMIDFLKCVATMCVFCLHVGIIAGNRFSFYYDQKTWMFQTPAWSSVWIFFTLSGALNGFSFFQNREYFKVNNIISFYVRRIKKVLLPCWCFSALALFLVEIEAFVENPIIIFKIITLRYYNDPAVTSIGATWYVYVLMQLYLLTPFFAYLINKILNNSNTKWHIIAVLIISGAGLLVRIMTYVFRIPWGAIYVPFYMNIDLYLSGMVTAHWISVCEHRKVRSNFDYKVGIISLLLLVVANTRLYYLCNVSSVAVFICQYVFPTIWLLFVCTYISLYMYRTESFDKKKIFEKIISCFSLISYYFYLVHSMAANQLAPFVKASTLNRRFALLLSLSFVFSALISYLMYRACNYEKHDIE